MTGAQMKAARRALGLTQEQLAVLWTVSVRTVQRMERSDAVPRWVVYALAGIEAREFAG